MKKPYVVDIPNNNFDNLETAPRIVKRFDSYEKALRFVLDCYMDGGVNPETGEVFESDYNETAIGSIKKVVL